MRFAKLTFAASVLMLAASHVQAQNISYNYLTTLSLASGTDAMQLNNATFDITFTVPDGTVYSTRFGFPEVPVTNPQLTVSGSGLAANNGTFALQTSSFYPTFAGLFSEPGGVADTITLPGGDSITLQINTNPTTAGAAVHTGDTVDVAQFGPATSQNFRLTDSTNSAQYNQNGTTVTAVHTTADVPEPGSLAFLVGMGMTGAGFLARRRRTTK